MEWWHVKRDVPLSERLAFAGIIFGIPLLYLVLFFFG